MPGPAEVRGDGLADMRTDSQRSNLSRKSSVSRTVTSLKSFVSSRSKPKGAAFGTLGGVRGTTGGLFEGFVLVSREATSCCAPRRSKRKRRFVVVKGVHCFVFKRDDAAATCSYAIPLKGVASRVNELSPRVVYLFEPDAGPRDVRQYCSFELTFEGAAYMEDQEKFILAVEEAAELAQLDSIADRHGVKHVDRSASVCGAQDLGEIAAQFQEPLTPQV